MPGILYHLTFAEMVALRLKEVLSPADRAEFLAGNLLPDLAKNKALSHFRKPASLDGMLVPDLQKAAELMLPPHRPLLFGAYCHLFLDASFIEEILIATFIWDKERKTVTSRESGLTVSIGEFFSDNGIYGAYTELNQLLIRDGYVSSELIDSIPDVIPKTGIEFLDYRREMSWREELNGYLSEKRAYTGRLLRYEFISERFNTFADRLASSLQ
ncbi:MAG: hypothetical protein IJY04_03825 [Clostridia bacterium]|nr:hypothetical protein [Clostridia bacterium]